MFLFGVVIATDEQQDIRNRFQKVLDQYAALRPEALRAPNKRFGANK
jgi:hypothetical protein